MSDLRHRHDLMQTLINHIDDREGTKLFFYCDDRSPRGFVTIGLGELVDKSGASKATARGVADKWYEDRKGWLQFRHKNTHALANKAQVLDDWGRVFDHGLTHVGAPADTYAPVAHYRITQPHAERLLSDKLGRFIQKLYEKRPFVQQLDPLIHMALVDARYNNARVALYDMHNDPHDHFHPDIPVMWRLMNPGSPDYNLQEALLVFERIWAHRAGARYQERHRTRVHWFHSGVIRMLGPAGPVTP